eukprot:TRINITY_DN18374_c0_g1_i1.p1 TRINITY_DN18374_c0_g1~~TRINITY_DN18374_c0_g1_i1.p1  ORF type:complete len:136 (-),score=29.82 TRINITY_DN18374_c0_g1_i1:17-424(-)
MIRLPRRSTHCISSAASDVYKRQYQRRVHGNQQQPKKRTKQQNRKSEKRMRGTIQWQIPEQKTEKEPKNRIFDLNEQREKRELQQHIRIMVQPVSYTHLRAHETRHDLVCRLLLEKKKKYHSEKSLNPTRRIQRE